jgi:co-chaperonin GroES (HSP10)
MKPIGKTYLIKADVKKDIELVNGIFIPNDFDAIEDIYYQGYIVAYGTGYTEEEIKNLVPIDTKVLFNYRGKRGMKLVFGSSTYYVKDEADILGVVENE